MPANWGREKKRHGRTWTGLGGHEAAVKNRVTCPLHPLRPLHSLRPLVEVPHLVSLIWSESKTCSAAFGRPKCR